MLFYFQNLPSYSGARVLILGGGDGALLKELMELDVEVGHVTLVDIDECVMRACAEHMPKVAGKYLGQRSGDRFQVVAGDAFAFMEEAKVNRSTLMLIYGYQTHGTLITSNNGLGELRRGIPGKE